MDISKGVTLIPSHSRSYTSRKRKLTQSVLLDDSRDMARGRTIGPKKRQESKGNVENMRGRTKQRGLRTPCRAEKRISRRSALGASTMENGLYRVS